MRKLIFQMLISVDGFFEGMSREIDWHNVDNEFNEYAINFLNSVDLLLFGRTTYELMASYWPTKQALIDDPIVTGKMNSLNKIVFSRTMDRADWENTKLVKDKISDEIKKLKMLPGKDIAIFGSSELALTFIKYDLIDEFHILVNPVALGKGKTLFEGIKEKLNLKLIKTKTFRNGNVMLYYKPLN